MLLITSLLVVGRLLHASAELRGSELSVGHISEGGHSQSERVLVTVELLDPVHVVGKDLLTVLSLRADVVLSILRLESLEELLVVGIRVKVQAQGHSKQNKENGFHSSQRYFEKLDGGNQPLRL